MGTLALLVDRRGSRLELGPNQTLVVHRPDAPCERVGLKALSEVLLFGDVALDSRVLRTLANAGIVVDNPATLAASSLTACTTPARRTS